MAWQRGAELRMERKIDQPVVGETRMSRSGYIEIANPRFSLEISL